MCSLFCIVRHDWNGAGEIARAHGMRPYGIFPATCLKWHGRPKGAPTECSGDVIEVALAKWRGRTECAPTNWECQIYEWGDVGIAPYIRVFPRYI